MSFLQKLFNFFTPRPASAGRYYPLKVQCRRCGETIEGRVDLLNELSIEYADSAETYHCRKVMLGQGRCFQPIEIALKFDSKRRLTERTPAASLSKHDLSIYSPDGCARL
jgi:hypothetical protein